MTVRSITFTGPMIAALLDGRKTQTRRVLKSVPLKGSEHDAEWNPHAVPPGGACPDEWTFWDGPAHGPSLYHSERISFETGDLLCVREAYYQRGHWEPVEGKLTKKGRQKWEFVPESDHIVFDPPAEFRGGRRHADPHTVAWHKRLGRFMPSKYSRLTLKVTDVRVQRVQEISEADARAEGVRVLPMQREDDPSAWWEVEPGKHQARTPRGSFRSLWNSINTDRGFGWDVNPWVVAISFSVIRQNVDEYLNGEAA